MNRITKGLAAVSATALIVAGSLGAASAALADETAAPAAPTQEVASSPDATQPDSSTSTGATDATSEDASSTPTTVDTPADSATPTDPAGSPATDESAAATPPATAPTPAADHIDSAADPIQQQKAPEAAGDEWFTWLLPVTTVAQQGHVGALPEWFPQQPVGPTQIAPQPGTCVQQDHYTGPRHKLDALYAAPLTWNAKAGHASDNDVPGLKVVDWTIICAPEQPPVVTQQCTSDTSGATSTNLDRAGWTDIDTRTAGHSEYVDGGLHVWTDDASSNAKVQQATPASFALSNTGTLSVNWDGSSVPPGLQLFVNFGADGNGTLVYEGVYGQDVWLTNGSSAAVKANAPSHTGGNGSDNHGTINEWLAKYPDAQVTGVGFSLGSGVKGDGILRSISTGCGSWAFDYEAPVVIPADATATVSVTQPTCDEPGVPSVTAEHATLQGKLDETPGDHVATFIADEGHTNAEGKTEFTVAYTVLAATGDCPVTTPTPTPTPSGPATVVETGTPTPQVLASTSEDTLAHTGTSVNYWPAVIAALLALIAGACIGVARVIRHRTAK